MFYIYKLTDSIEDCTRDYDFVREINPTWKISYRLSLAQRGASCPAQNDLTDFEYFLLLRRLEKSCERYPADHYLFYVGKTPVTSLYVMRIDPHIVNISFMTIPKHQRKGYATEAVKLLENTLFKDLEIGFIQITDMTEKGISGRIARKLRYIYQGDNNYIKPNPILMARIPKEDLPIHL